MNKEYKVDKEYSILEMVRYNLRMWWAAALLALLFAGLLGGYKVVTLHPYVDNEVYEDKMQVKAALFIHEYSSGNVTERATNMIKIADSSRAYNAFIRTTGLDITIEEYRNMFDMEQTEASDVVSMYITFPYTYGEYTIEDETDAMTFMNGLVKAVDEASQELVDQKCVSVLDAPYATKEVEKINNFSISESDYKKAILKAVTAGILLGIIVEVALYTLWMLLYKKPKNANEIRECLNTEIIDIIKGTAGDAESYKRAALFLKRDADCVKMNCLAIGGVKDDAALKLATCYSNEQKKTLYVDLNDSGEEKYSISNFITGKEDTVSEPEKLNAYLDAYHRNRKAEDGIEITGSSRFAQFLRDMSQNYEYIIVSGSDCIRNTEGYQVSKLCDVTFAVCARKQVKNELLYRVKNTTEINDIRIDGVIVYDI